MKSDKQISCKAIYRDDDSITFKITQRYMNNKSIEIVLDVINIKHHDKNKITELVQLHAKKISSELEETDKKFNDIISFNFDIDD